MKHLRFSMQPDRRTTVRLLLLALISSTCFLPSCTDGDEGLTGSSRFSFTATVSDSTERATRSDRGSGLPKDTVTAVEGYDTPLYLHTVYEDGITCEGVDNVSDRADKDAHTRAAAVTGMYDSFAVSAYSYKGTWNESLTPNWFHGVKATLSDGSYALASTYYWPGSVYKMKFFAYAPTGNTSYVLSGSTQAGYPTLTVTVPTDVAKQQDLLASQSDELAGNYRNDVSLSFKHILTAVKFVCGDDMAEGTINSVTLKGVYSKGTYNMGKESWSNISTATDFTQTLNKTATSGEAITTDAQTFMMIPQTLPTGAQIEVKFTDSNNTEHTLTADISGQAWPKGSTVTYKISTSSLNISWDYTLRVSGSNPITFTHDGYYGSSKYYNCDVYSYKKNKANSDQPELVPCTVTYSTDGGSTWVDTKPDWITGITCKEEKEYNDYSYKITVAAQTGVKSGTNHAAILKKSRAKGSSNSPYNLSNSSGRTQVQNTANCYVVSAPGYYSFPLVYGNAIKNFNTNSSAYTSTQSGSTILTSFVNHLGNAITSPYISNNTGCTPKSAELVWQDAPNLVTSIKYNSGTNGGNISFYVDTSNICQGNAVIAVKDNSGNVLWSWHIWVTDEDLSKTIAVTNYSNETNYFMPVNLGWCDSELTTYAERSCMVKFTATEGGNSAEVTIKQSAGSDGTWANSPFYQWGRKDPFLPALCYMSGNYLRANNKTWYDNSGTEYTSKPQSDKLETTTYGTDVIKHYILNPGTYTYTVCTYPVLSGATNTGYGAGDNAYYNLWSADNTVYLLGSHDTKVVKTIYDPCPVGFTVPPGKAFTGFNKDGSTIYASGTDIYGKWSSSADHYGMDFGTSGTSTWTNTIFFGYLGYRYYDGSWQDDGRYWTAVPTVTGESSAKWQGGLLKFSAYSLVTAHAGTGRSYGLSIRPTKEQ